MRKNGLYLKYPYNFLQETKRNAKKCVLIVTLVLIVCNFSLADKIIYVDDDNPADFNNIQAAVDYSNDGDTILIYPGTYTGFGNRDIELNNKNITISSIDPNDPAIVASTIIDCQGSATESHRGFYFYGLNCTATVTGLTISNGYCSNGGGIKCDEYSKPRIQLCRIINCFSNRGGGIYIGIGSPIIDKCTIANNIADNPNFRGEGAGIYSSSGSENTEISNCIIVNNRTLDNQNIDKGIGGGIYHGISGITLKNCTISGNQAETGGGITADERGTTNIINCIVYGNNGSEIEGNPTVTYSNIQGGFPGEGNIDLIPEFINPDNNDFHLSPSSPCIDSGDSEFVPFDMETDIDGNPRVMGIRVDMGADEFIATTTPVIKLSTKSFIFNTDEGNPNLLIQNLLISSVSTANLNWNISEDISWLDTYPTNGESTYISDEVSLVVSPANLLPGTYSGEIIITANDAPNSPQIISVTLNIRAISGILNVPLQYYTIQSAIDAAKNGDTVLIEPGIYTGPGNVDIDIKGKTITVQSIDPNNPNVVTNTIIDCNGDGSNWHRGFIFDSQEDSHSKIAGLTITGGCSLEGSGIYIKNSSPVISNCIIKNNICKADDDIYIGYNKKGSGIFINGGNPVISDCNISYNISLISDSRGNGTIADSASNATRGGGIYCMYAQPVIRKCRINGNHSRTSGGGIYLDFCENFLIEDSTICDNVTYRVGGGIDIGYSNGIIRNCLISGNESQYGGSGLELGDCHVDIVNCTIANNNSFLDDSGGLSYTLSDINILNSILWNNDNPQNAQVHVYSWSGIYDGPSDPTPIINSTLNISFCNLQNGLDSVSVSGDPEWFLLNWDESNIDMNPLFNDPNNNDYYLKSQAGRYDTNTQIWIQDDVTSPCIDTGDPNSPIGLEPFPNGGYVNMGAYGGTSQASKTYFGKPLCETIVAGDINGDCRVDILDMEIMLSHWLEEH